MSKSGVIAISRKLFDPEDPFFGGEPFTRREAWAWMIAEAAYKPRVVKVSTGLGHTTVEVRRGELCHSRGFMASAWRWSEKQVRTFLDALERSERIVRSGGQAFFDETQKQGQANGQANGQAKGQARNIITICKYDEYQFPISDQGQSNGQADGTAKGPTMGQASAKKGPEVEEGLNNKRKNARTRAAEPDGFAEWYGIYPKKAARKHAAKMYEKVIAAGEISADLLLQRTAAFATQWQRRPESEHKYIPDPGTWLNKGNYDDDALVKAGRPAAAAPPPPDPSTFSEARWRQLMALHAQTGQWGSHWGPAPGAPGCLVPTALLHTRSRSPPGIDAIGEAEAIH